MALARNFPGLALSVDDVNEMTPEMTAALKKAGKKVLDVEREERWAHTRMIALGVRGGR